MSRDIDQHTWAGAALGLGTHLGTAPRGGALVIGRPVGLRTYTDPYADPADGRERRVYEYAAWVSPEVHPGFALTELIASWNAATPAGCWVEVEARVSPDGLTMSRWFTLGRWAETDAEIHPTSVPGQQDDLATVAIDQLTARGEWEFTSYQLRVTLLRRPGGTESPSVRLASVMASHVPAEPPAEVSAPGRARGTVLELPAYSQQLHRGEYPQWDNGGESWCSPTSTSMVLAHWGVGPTPDDYAWVDPGFTDRWIDYAARHTFDHAYKGAGNWSFNTAYAARFGMVAYVTRLRSLAEAEEYVAAGIPLVVTVSFTRDQLDGAGYDTTGHLLTVIGFDDDGNVVSNDPASHLVPSNDKVRTTYDRAQFERVWLGSAGGVTYVIHPPGHPCPGRHS